MARLLLVEDSRYVTHPLRRLLAAHGHEVHIFRTGEEALESLERWLPDLVILDLMLPGLSGADVLRRMRAAEHTRALPVVMLSSGMAAGTAEALLAAGAQACLPKASRDAGQLPNTITRLLAADAA